MNVSNVANGTVINNTANITFNTSNSTVFAFDTENTTIINNLTATSTLTKTDSPDPVAPGGTLTYTLIYTVTNGTAFNVTINDTLPPELTFVSSTPAATSGNNTWLAGNLTVGQSFTINITSTVNTNTTIGTIINNTAFANFENSTGSQSSINASSNTTTQSPASSGSSGGGGGGGGGSVCPPICQNPTYRNLPQCNNCPPLPINQTSIQAPSFSADSLFSSISSPAQKITKPIEIKEQQKQSLSKPPIIQSPQKPNTLPHAKITVPTQWFVWLFYGLSALSVIALSARLAKKHKPLQPHQKNHPSSQKYTRTK